MLKRLIIHSYRTGFRDRWTKTYQWYFIGVNAVIILIGLVNSILKLSTNGEIGFQSTTFTAIYWLCIILINFNSLYTYLSIKKGKKYLKEYNEKLKTYDKVICGWDDEELERGKVYEVEHYSVGRVNTIWDGTKLKGTDFFLGDWKYSAFRLVSLKEQRRLKLKELGV